MPSPRYWREVPSRFRLEAVRCRTCGKVSFPARRICPACRATQFENLTLSREGRVVTSTVLYVAPSEFARSSATVVHSTGSVLDVKDGVPRVPGQPEP